MRSSAYYEKSCPKCGKPSYDGGRQAVNKVPLRANRNKIKCRCCGTLLWEKK